MSRSLLHLQLSSIQTGFEAILKLSFIGGALILIALLLHAILQKKLSVNWLYLMWGLVILRFIFVSVPESPTSLMNLFTSTRAATESKQTRENDAWEVNPHADATGLTFSSPNELQPIETSHQTPQSVWKIREILPWVWLTGIAWMLVSLVISAIRVKSLIRNSTPLSPTQLRDFEKLKHHLGFRHSVSIRQTDKINFPAMAGIRRPVVLLPSWSLTELTQDQLELVVAHEWVHIRRRDNLMQLAAHLVSILHWFNPLIRTALKRLESSRELSCDQRVIKAMTKFFGPETHRIYGRTILQVAMHSNTTKSISPVFLGGFTGTDNRLIKQRIEMIVQPMSKRNVKTICSAICLSLIICVGFTAAQTPPLDSPPKGNEKNLNSQPESIRLVDSDQEGIQSDDDVQIAILIQEFEISTDRMVQLGIDWSEIDGAPQELESVRQALSTSTNTPERITNREINVGLVSNTFFPKFLDALKERNVAKLVSSPTLVVRTYRTAEFLKGGEIPIVKQKPDGTEVIEFKPFGTQLKIRPSIKQEGHVNLEIVAEFSHLDENLVDAAGIPGFHTRRINTAVCLPFGQTVAIVRKNEDPEEEDVSEIVTLLTPRQIPLVTENKNGGNIK